MQIYNRTHNVFVIKNCGKFFEKLGSIESKNFQLKEILGIVSNENNLTYCDKSNQIQASFEDTLLWTGEWIGLFYDENSKTGLFSSDFFGFGQIFYSICDVHNEKTLIVGNSFRGVAQAVKKLSGKFGINWHIAMPHLSSVTNLFSTRCSFETFSSDINVLHDDEMLLFGKKGISIVRKPRPTYLDSLSYDDLIQKGIEKACKMIGVATNSGLVNELSLSGGKDSRALLGLILASGKYQDISVYTAASSGVAAGASREILDQDFSLACRLMEYYDLSWNTNSDFDEYKISFDEAVSNWQNLRSNSSFDFRPKYSQVVGKKEIRFTGIGGELFRSYIGIGYKEGFPQWWNNAGKSKASIRQDLASLFRALCPSQYLDEKLYQKSLDAFVDAMDFGYGDDVIQQLDINYGKYRSRCHSGVAHTHYSEGALLSYPLCLPEFVYASKKLSRHDQEQGRTLFDILEQTDPNLNALSYASPPWDSSFKTKGSRDWSKFDGFKQRDSYDALIKARTKKIEQRNIQSFNFDTACLQRLNQNMNTLRQFSLDNGIYFFDGITQRVARAYQKSAQHLYASVSKTETLLDIIENKNIDLSFSVVDLNNPTFVIKSDIEPAYKNEIQYTKNSVCNFENICQEIDMSDFSFYADLNQDEKKVFVYFYNIKEHCEIACYLYEDGVKIDQIWYTQNRVMYFSVPNMDIKKRYRLTVFYKWDNESMAQKTESLTLN
ncbi:hypothetical protein AM305_11545 [Actinobacillus minor NM305]|uniref:Asparagine synthetase domain-containing protein n=1 Tax=Actinobacillus minor NM305 TaxID=637911 RepID=C5S355_9PAST|nr:hypothetical protein [Actinobacillus minor]EER46657.1 hypothetical protein AM305_11545 [Actinobacillus minor NM305]